MINHQLFCRSKNWRNQVISGFSLIELMIVVAIMGILVAVALPQFQDMISDTKKAKARATIDTLARTIDRFNSMEGRPVRELSDLAGKYMADIDELVDPWGMEYQLDVGAGDVISAGPDQLFGTRDDIRMSYLGPLRLVDAVYTALIFGGDTPTTDDDDRDELLLIFNKPVGVLEVAGNTLFSQLKDPGTAGVLAGNFSPAELGLELVYPRRDNGSYRDGSEDGGVMTELFVDSVDGIEAVEISLDDPREVLIIVNSKVNRDAVAAGWGIVPNSTRINLFTPGPGELDRSPVWFDSSWDEAGDPNAAGRRTGTDSVIRAN